MGLDYANISLYNSLPISTDVPVDVHAVVDHRVLLFTIAAAILSTFLFGLAPAFQTTRLDLVPALQAADADSGGRRRLWGRNFIVAGQVTLSLVLLVISVVIWQGFRNQYKQGSGFRTDHLYLTSFDTTSSHYSEEQTRRFYKDLLDKTRLAPGVRSAALTSAIPLGNGFDSTGVLPEDYSLPRGEKPPTAEDCYVSDGFFATLGIPILRGRGFLKSDRADTTPVAVVNTQFAERYWPHQDALGKRFHVGDANGPLAQVVGIARTGKYIWIAEAPQEFVYFPYTQARNSAFTVVAESTGLDAGTLAPVLRDVVRTIDPAMPYANARTMHNLFSERATKGYRHHRRSCRESWNDGSAAGAGWALRAGGVLGEQAFARDRHPHGDWRGPARRAAHGVAPRTGAGFHGRRRRTNPESSGLPCSQLGALDRPPQLLPAAGRRLAGSGRDITSGLCSGTSGIADRSDARAPG